MTTLKKGLLRILTLGFIFTITACTPEVGSDGWCSMMKEKPKGEWTANEAGDYTKFCILSLNDK